MIRYDLDRLGWHDFEAAIEVLLKAMLGIGVESWGSTHGDWGRDAYFKGTLFYPTNQPATGEFVFQCKFVQGANAAGARPESALNNAVKSECGRIKKRGAQPLHYALITNAPLSPTLHTSLARRLSSVMPNTEIHLHGANDVCDWFDLTPHVANAFPQVLGLRHLHDLLRSWSRPGLIKRSRLLIDHAAEEATTFVPTHAFRQAFDVVRTRSLVMLEGPPEMGKTTIGRMLALAAVASDKMEAIECPRPRDLFDAHDDERAQVFVVDDCFGRSSYDPTLGTEWERELGSALRLLDSKHWLVLTSRAHLLSFALSALDFDRRAAERLSQCRVLVDAEALSEIEKAQILYRHGKHARLSSERHFELRKMVSSIINDDKFTPERIRVLVERVSSERGPIKELVKECLETPTNSMRKSFRALPDQHKWLLYAFLEQSGWVLTSSLEKSYNTLCPDDVRRPLKEVIVQLDNAFIKTSKHGLSIDVVHPTVLDLLVEELALDVRARQRYLERCEGGGLTVALMFRGGGRGTTIAPLLAGEAEWTLVEARGIEELRKGRAHAVELLRLIRRHNQNTKLGARAEQALRVIGDTTINEVNKEDLWTTDSVLIFSRAMRGFCVPVIDGVWKRQRVAVKHELNEAGSLQRRHTRLKELSELAELVIHKRWAAIADKTLLWNAVCQTLQWLYDGEVWSDDLDDWGSWDDDELDDAEEVVQTIEETIETLRSCLPGSDITNRKLIERIKQANDRAQEMESSCQSLRNAIECKREDVEAKLQETNARTSTQRNIDIDSVFEDF